MSKKKSSPEFVDLTTPNKDYAVFLPSISSIYVKFVSQHLVGKREGLPVGLRRSWDDLDFLQEKGDLFSYKWALYSAGHAMLDPEKSDIGECMVQKRDRSRNVIIGDSGGFQAATGVLKWPWKPKKNQSEADWRSDQDAFRMSILRWLEHTADWSMIFDFPPGGIDRFGYDEKTGIAKHPGLKSYEDCLKGSIENAQFFIKHRREGATKFLNVLQGRNMQEGDEWWEICKDWPFESFAFANIQGHSIALNLRRMIIMRDSGYLEGRDWLHYLGNGKIKASCSLTNIQRALRKYVNPNVTLSYDAASPFVMTAKGQMYNTYEISPNRLGFKGGSIPDAKELKGSKVMLNDWIAEQLELQNQIQGGGETTFDSLFEHQHVSRVQAVDTAISRRITLGDICVKGYEDLEGKDISATTEALQNELGILKWENHEERRKKYPSSLDGLSYVLLMNHNVELHIRACQEACYWMDQPLSVARQHLPSDVLEFKDLCPEIFTSEKPMTLIEKHWNMLTNGTGMNADNGMSMDLGKIQGDR